MKAAFLALLRNDLRLFFADRRAVIATILVPVGIASFFSMIFGNQSRSGEKAKLTLQVADQDRSAVTQKLVAQLKESPLFTVTETDPGTARDTVARGKVTVALLLPSGFGKAAAGALFNPTTEKPTVTLLYDPAHAVDLQVARGLVLEKVMQVVSQESFSHPDLGGVDSALQSLAADKTRNPEQKAALTGLLQSVQRWGKSQASTSSAAPSESAPVGGFSLPITLADEAVVGGRSSGEPADKSGGNASMTHTFVGMGVQGLLFFAIDFGIGMVRDRRAGLWKRLRAAPLPRAVLLGSRLASSTLIGVLVLTAIFGFGALAFGLRIHGSVVGFALIGSTAAMMVAGFGLLIAALGKTEAQCRAFSIPLVLSMTILGGAWFPTFMMPQWMQGVSQMLPTRWAVEGFDAMTWRGLDFTSALLPAGIVFAFALAFSGFALSRFRWEAD